MSAPAVSPFMGQGPGARRTSAGALALAVALLFVATNRGAYQGYFSDDDLENLSWPTYVGNDVYARALVSPVFEGFNFRPVGDLYYRSLYRIFHLNYRAYVAVLQLMHIVNAVLLVALLARLGFSAWAAGAGALFFIFHAAALEAYWKPMYVFDVLCCAFCLTACLLYIRGHWILALVPFWLAYKSKEIAIMLPVALLAYEWLLGERKWKRLIPYFAISLSFGLQALWWDVNFPPDNPYALRFRPQALFQTVAAYSSSILFLPFAGFAWLLLPLFLRERRLYLGLILAGSLLFPMLALPGRVESVYWYVPMVGLGMAVAVVASRVPRWAVAAFFVFWLPVNYAVLREKRRSILAIADENRWYTTGLLDYARRVPALKAVVFQGIPAHVQRFGVEAAIHVVFGPGVATAWYLDAGVRTALAQTPMAIVTYYPVERLVRGLLRTSDVPGGQSYVRFEDARQESQLGPGWYERVAGGRESAPKASVALYRPAGASEFELAAAWPPARGPQDATPQITVFENGRSMGTQILPRSAQPSRLHWKLPAGEPGVCDITILTEPARLAPGDARDLGAVVYSAGYVSP